VLVAQVVELSLVLQLVRVLTVVQEEKIALMTLDDQIEKGAQILLAVSGRHNYSVQQHQSPWVQKVDHDMTCSTVGCSDRRNSAGLASCGIPKGGSYATLTDTRKSVTASSGLSLVPPHTKHT
jgi:hypothetical protein